MARLYISGPVTGKPDDNREAFRRAQRTLMAKGYGVDIPHDIVPDYVEDWRGAMLHCLHHLTMTRVRCDKGHKGERTGIPYVQGIAMLPGWEQSEGARLEKAVAEACGIECKTVDEWIQERI